MKLITSIISKDLNFELIFPNTFILLISGHLKYSLSIHLALSNHIFDLAMSLIKRSKNLTEVLKFRLSLALNVR